ncbi:MAG TPA: CNNM domain-containing protein [Patescibacteria group bacterium]
MIIFYLFLIFLLIAINGFFVASEIILISTRKSKIETLINHGNNQAKFVKQALNNLQSYITVIQLTITFSSLSIGWIGQAAINQYILDINSQNILIRFFIKSGIVAFIALLSLSLLHLILGELLPKNLVFRISENNRIVIIRPLNYLVRLLQPIISILNKFIEKILKIIGKNKITQDFYSQEELETILLSNMKQGLLTQEEFYLIRSIKHLKNTPIKKILIEKKKIVGFDVKMSLSDIKNVILLRRYTYNRYPIYKKTLNKIIGFIHINDIFSEKTTNNYIKPILQININSRLDRTLINMYKNKKFAAVVIDNNKNTCGLIVLSDIINYWLKNLI